MTKLKIIKKEGFIYTLKDNKEREYVLNIEFHDISKDPEVGDSISISAELLNTNYAGYSTCYTFGSLESEYGKTEIKLNDIDVIILETEDKEIYLKRLYG